MSIIIYVYGGSRQKQRRFSASPAAPLHRAYCSMWAVLCHSRWYSTKPIPVSYLVLLFFYWEVEDFLPWNSLIPNWLVSKYTSVLPWLEVPNTDQKFWPSYFRNAIAYPFVDHMMNPEFWGRTKPSVWTPSSCKHQARADLERSDLISKPTYNAQKCALV